MQLLHLIISITFAAGFSAAAVAPGVPHVSLSIDRSTSYQTIDGFGFCEAFQRAHAISNLPLPYQKDVLDLLFGKVHGAGFSILRLGLGSSPDSRLDHMNSPQPDSEGAFSWDHRDSGQVWVAQQAKRYGVEMFYADAWSAPGYMKTNGRDDQGGWLCGVSGEGMADGTSCHGVSWVQAYAEYLARYVQAYIQEGIPISFVGHLNEPNLIKPYATMQSNGYQAADSIFAMAVALGGLGLNSVGISCCEGQGWSYAKNILAEIQNAGAEGALSLITTHTYKGTPPGPDGPLNTTLPVWVTEISPIMQRLGMTETWYRNLSENEGLTHAINLHEAFVTGNVSAYIYWIGVGQNNMWAPNDANTAMSTNISAPYYTIGSTYWASAQFSRFVRPGAKRIRVVQSDMGTGVTANILASAYLNKDGSVVVQVINNDDLDTWVDTSPGPLPSQQRCKAETWLTDNANKFVLYDEGTTRNGLVVGRLLPRRSLTTFVLKC
ncbi:glycoside hydrolase family 30 protein [Podospora didyma]|uniref:Glycoside hydrolase family 30 protein n=1 Tax=Podospora didyma TaxID=330526 RepID=A0AAE0NR72_9PEZI|nr:glycoside hydrolase family 30 protein [Podospora didyma]